MTRPIRILLVEDSPGDADLIKDTLEEGAYHLDITIVGDGAEAVEYLRRRPTPDEAVTPRPDLVLLDLNLPKLSGHEVLSEARKSRDLLTLPIIVVTSSDATRDIVTSYTLGANCYVTKPGELVAFQTTVRALGAFWLSIVKLP
jgi:chemotaxis family two-component system response regulator Rcp1